MGKENRISSDMTVDMVMRNWPETIAVILRRRMQCVGCPLAIFHTISYVAKEYSLDEQTLLQELNDAISNDPD